MRYAFALRPFVEHHEVLVSDELCEHLVDELRVYHGQQLLHKLVLGLGLHVGLVVEEVVYQRIYELAVLAGVCALDGSFGVGEQLRLGPVDFAVGEAEALHLLDFGHQGLECFEGAVGILAVHASHYHLAGLAYLAEAEAGRDEVRVGGGSEVGEPLVHHTADDALDNLGEVAYRGAVEFLGSGLAFPERGICDAAGLGVGDYADYGLLIVGNGNHGLGLGILLCGDVGEDSLYLGLHLVYVDITHDDERLQVGTVPGMVEVHETLGLEVLEVLLAADYGRGGILGVAEDVGLLLLVDSPGCVVARALLLEYHSALLVDLLGIAGHEVRVVVHYQQAGVHDCGPH